MSAIESYILIFCGSSIVCTGVLFLFLLVVARRTGGSAMMIPALSMLANMLFRDKGGEAEDEDSERRSPSRRRREAETSRRSFDARSQAAEDDFDAALQRNRGGRSARPGRPRPRSRTGGDSDDSQPPSLRGNPSRSRRDTRRGNLDSADDEILGGVLDDDGDGYSDY